MPWSGSKAGRAKVRRHRRAGSLEQPGSCSGPSEPPSVPGRGGQARRQAPLTACRRHMPPERCTHRPGRAENGMGRHGLVSTKLRRPYRGRREDATKESSTAAVLAGRGRRPAGTALLRSPPDLREQISAEWDYTGDVIWAGLSRLVERDVQT